MRAKLFSVALVTFLVMGFLTTGIGQASPSNQSKAAPIRLKAATFVPSRGEAPAIPRGLMIAGYAHGQRGYYLVQFHGPVEQAWKDQVAALGAELLEYVPDFAFKVRMTPAQAAKVQNLQSVAWVGLFHPAYKLSPDVIRTGTTIYKVRVERGVDAGFTAAAVARTGAQVLGREGSMLLVAADSAQLDAIAHVLDVAWVQRLILPEKHNETGAGSIMGASTANANGYDGSTQIVAVADTGLGGGTASTAHADIPSSRITAIYNWPGASDSCWSITDDGAVDVDSGHGTHVAGSVLSDGDSSGRGKGTAPAAKLVFQATENWANMKGLCAVYYPDGYYLTGLPSDLRQLFQQAYDAGARIHSNSWGSAVAGDYTADSAYADEFIWYHQDMAITFSAGNEGIDSNSDGVIDNDSIGSPATGKNVITVGASENQRSDDYACDTGLSYSDAKGNTCSSLGGKNDIFTWGAAWPNDYPAEPIKSDKSAGNAEQMAAFSSRGPTDDGRIKPDVVAPGSWILSAYSDLYQQGYDSSTNPQNNAWQYDGYGFPLSAQYKYLSGTSMSNPLAAGGAAVVRDFYQKAHGHGASAALVKATLINSAVDMLDENNDGANDNDYPIPNVHEGWGRVSVANATDGSHKWIDTSAGLGTGGSVSYQYSIGTSGSPLKVTLVWSDYPSTESASKNLVNDLDLEVTSPSGAVYKGNVFSGGWSQTGGSADRTNNVENVYVQSAASGTWTVRVKGYNVPNGPQPFALVVDGAFGTSTEPTATPTSEPTATPAPTSEPTPSPTATPSSNTLHIGDLDGSAISSGNSWRATVTITVHDANENPVANATVSGTWSGGYSGTASCTTDSTGRCTVSTSSMHKKNGSVTFTVSAVSHSTLTYSSAANHDPDGDSNGTSITVYKP